jgi:hypothetical protein
VGTWGTGLFDDDVAADARSSFEEAIRSGQSPDRAAALVLEELEEEAKDPDDAPVLTLALASLLLDSGVRDHPLFDAAREIIESGEGLERWEEAGEAALAQRRAVYGQLAERLQ